MIIIIERYIILNFKYKYIYLKYFNKFKMAIRKSNTFLSILNDYLIDSPEPSNISYWWNLGSLLGLCLVIQLATGIFLAMHYSSNLELAFISVQHIMIDVNYGWLIRYCHSNGAGFFFIFVYMHMARGIYYGSYRRPRIALWVVGVVIFLLMIITAFMGYCLVYGQMSHWGFLIIASNVLIISNSIKNLTKYPILLDITHRKNVNNFIGPLNHDIISIIYGSLLGDGHCEKRIGGKGSRISFYQESSHDDYLLYLHSIIANLGYCNTKIPKIITRLGNKGKIRKIIRFRTWTYISFNFIFESWYKQQDSKNIKIIPHNINEYLTPLALAIWIMDDGSKVSQGLKLCTNCFTYEENIYLTQILLKKYGLKATVISAGTKNQYNIYIWKESMILLRNIVKPYIIPSMKYKLDIK